MAESSAGRPRSRASYDANSSRSSTEAEKASKTLKVGEFTRVKIVGTQGHDLVGQPI